MGQPTPRAPSLNPLPGNSTRGGPAPPCALRPGGGGGGPGPKARSEAVRRHGSGGGPAVPERLLPRSRKKSPGARLATKEGSVGGLGRRARSGAARLPFEHKRARQARREFPQLRFFDKLRASRTPAVGFWARLLHAANWFEVACKRIFDVRCV